MSMNYAEARKRARGEQDGLDRQMPDDTAHHPAGPLFILGGLGIFIGVCANLWQVGTSALALWSRFVPDGSPISWGKQPVIAVICWLVAIVVQYGLLTMVFRLDRSWKDARAQGRGGSRSLAIEIVQHANLVVIFGLFSFVVDTIGDFTFIRFYTNATFLVVVYAVTLYAASTIMLVKAIEYLWAGFRASAAIRAENGKKES